MFYIETGETATGVNSYTSYLLQNSESDAEEFSLYLLVI